MSDSYPDSPLQHCGSMLSLNQEHSPHHRSNAPLKMEENEPHATITVFLTHHGSMMVACWRQSGTLLSFFHSVSQFTFRN